MWICLCNAINESMIDDYLDGIGAKTNHRDVYRGCSGGADYNCGNCKPEIKKIVDHHNNALTVAELSGEMQKIAAAKTKETA